jgi:hypothetical protein
VPVVGSSGSGEVGFGLRLTRDELIKKKTRDELTHVVSFLYSEELNIDSRPFFVFSLVFLLTSLKMWILTELGILTVKKSRKEKVHFFLFRASKF